MAFGRFTNSYAASAVFVADAVGAAVRRLTPDMPGAFVTAWRLSR